MNQLLNVKKDEVKEAVSDESGDISNQVVSGYVPKMGLFEEFEA
jgi:hypothetical protein